MFNEGETVLGAVLDAFSKPLDGKNYTASSVVIIALMISTFER